MRRGFSTRLTNLLVQDEVITRDNANEACKIHEQKGGRIEHILVEQGFADEDDIVSYSSLILESVPIHLDGVRVPDDVLQLVPGNIAIKHQLIPISRILDTLTLAMANPWDIYAIDTIEKLTKLSVSPVLSSWKDVREAIQRSYMSSGELLADYLDETQQGEGLRASQDEIGEQPQDLASVEKSYMSSGELLADYLEKIQQGERLEAIQDEIAEEPQDLASLERLAEDAPIVGLVDLIMRQAIGRKASDIHIGPCQGRLRVRFRIDGVLEEVNSLPKRLHPAVVSRIKIMSNMNIAERRQPLDGRLKLKTPRGNVNVRVSTMPTVLGENVVMRIADEVNMLALDQLGMPEDMLERYAENMERPHGMILVTGPTGSGKTSTLYASLNQVTKPDVNVVTIEDPVECLSEGLNQIEINPKAGRTFASVLRSILRQDPDIVMVGEIRDFETAQLAIQAALTGHLVFSTLHTNDAPSAIPRLLDLEVEPFLISASVSCVIAQRLVRVLCTNCKKSYTPSQKLMDELKLPPGAYTFFEKRECPICGGKGYRGRTGVYEVMFVNDEIKELIHQKSDLMSIQDAAIRNGMKTLRQAAIDKVVAGVTTVEEAFRVTSV